MMGAFYLIYNFQSNHPAEIEFSVSVKAKIVRVCKKRSRDKDSVCNSYLLRHYHHVALSPIPEAGLRINYHLLDNCSRKLSHQAAFQKFYKSVCGFCLT